MDHMRISDIEHSPVILNQPKYCKTWDLIPKWCQKQVEANRDAAITSKLQF